MTDFEIIELIQQNKTPKAIKALYSYFKVIKKYILANSGTKQDAEDVFQEALLLTLEKIKNPSFNLTASLNTFLFSVSKNMWLEVLKTKKHMHEFKPENNFVLNDENELQKANDKKLETAETAFLKLGKQCKDLLVNFYYKQLSMQEIARLMGFSTEAVAKNQKYRCLEKAKGFYLQLTQKHSHE